MYTYNTIFIFTIAQIKVENLKSYLINDGIMCFLSKCKSLQHSFSQSYSDASKTSWI